MSEHKTGNSNWTAKQKELYWERRKRQLRGQGGYINMHREIIDEDGKKQKLAVGFRRPK